MFKKMVCWCVGIMVGRLTVRTVRACLFRCSSMKLWKRLCVYCCDFVL